MKHITTVFIVAIAMALMGCAPAAIAVEDSDDDIGTDRRALSAEECEDRCMEEFHDCRNSPDRGGGPGASACAHDKNDCKSRC